MRQIEGAGKDQERPSFGMASGWASQEADRTDNLWTDDHIKQFLEKAPEHLHLPLILAVWTGQTQGDLLVLPWSGYDGQFIGDDAGALENSIQQRGGVAFGKDHVVVGGECGSSQS